MPQPKSKSSPLWLVFALLVLLAAAVSLYLLWDDPQAANASVSQELQTTLVRRGDLSMTVSGTGALAAAHTYDLSFSTTGLVQALNVQVGDMVTAGQVLALIDGGEELAVEIKALKSNLRTAQQELDDLLENAGETLVQAQLDLTDAEVALTEAQKNLRQEGQQRCTSSKLSTYYYEYLKAQSRVNQWEKYLTEPSGYGRNFLLDKLYPLWKERDLAYQNWKYCEGYTEEEILTSEAELAVAQAARDQAQAVYDRLLENQGIDPAAVALAELTIKNAELQLATARETLAGLEIVAPADGVVISIAAAVGEAVDEATYITLADLNPPVVETYIDETDIQYLEAGCSAQVVFNAIADRNFSGVVADISPQMVSDNGYGQVLASIDLEDTGAIAPGALPIGLKASVDIVCSQSQDVLFVPVEALQIDETGKYTVLLQTSSGEIVAQPVEIGLQTLEYVEIRSGLEEGQHVVVSGFENV
jgi:HlyD family secretion protein